MILAEQSSVNSLVSICVSIAAFGIVGCKDDSQEVLDDAFRRADSLRIEHSYSDPVERLERRLEMKDGTRSKGRISVDDITRTKAVTIMNRDTILKLGRAIEIVGPPPGNPAAHLNHKVVLLESGTEFLELHLLYGFGEGNDLLYIYRPGESMAKKYMIKPGFVDSLFEILYGVDGGGFHHSVQKRMDKFLEESDYLEKMKDDAEENSSE